MFSIEDRPVATPPAQQEVLIFKLGAEEYGIDIQRVQELRGSEPVTRIADAPPTMRGVVNLRGEVVPIVDMRVRMGLAGSLAEAGYGPSTVVVVLNIGARILGMVVDSVSDVIALGEDQIRPVPEGAGALGARYWTGMGMLDQRMVILLDIAALMSDEVGGLMDGGATAPHMN